MFAKIKTAILSFIRPIAARIYTMSVEADLTKGVAEIEGAMNALETEGEKLVTGVEEFIEPAKTVVQPIPVLNAVGGLAQAPIITAPAVPALASSTQIDGTVAKVKDLIILAEREVPASFDALAELAKFVASDANAWLAKMESLLDYGKAKPDVWNQIVAAVKAL